MDMNIQKYMAFVKTAEYGSFTKASEILQYSQSGISRMIHDLEEEWNVVLLERGRAGVRLTSDGVRLLERAKSICTEYEKLRLEVEELNGLESGLIRIGTFSSVATHWLPEIIEGFQKKYPNIEYEFLIGDYTEIENWIAIGRIDCGFLRLPTCPEYETIFIKEDPFRAVLAKENMTEKYKDKTKYMIADAQHDTDAHHDADTYRDVDVHYDANTHHDADEHSDIHENNCFKIKSLEGQKFLLLEKEENTEISDVLKTYGVHPDIRVTTWDDYAIMSMVERKIGSAILPDLILKRIPYDVEVRPLDVPACRKIGLAYKSKETCSAAMRRFLEYIKCEMLPAL